MKKSLAILLFGLATLFGQAQNGTHEYLSAQFASGWGKMTIIYANADPKDIDFTTVDKKDDKVWTKLALQEIQKLEDQGWEVLDVELTGAAFIWIMRKPKQ